MMLKCPFCGKADSKETVKGPPMGGYEDDPDIYQVRCEWCGACGPEGSTEEAAIKEWENRK
jgi:Lar family restriction alleviation protein